MPQALYIGKTKQRQEASMAEQTETGEFTDPRDGKKYKTVKIGSQTWLAENLNWEGAGVWYNGTLLFGSIFGRLYTWKEALTVAPPGWHLPTDEEWQKLVDFVGGDEVAVEKLRAKDGWDGNGTDAFGFSALPGGFRLRDGEFYHVGGGGNWWSTTEKDSEDAYYRRMSSGGAKVYRNDCYKGSAFSVRLVRD
jgi:uncharacterized protein (TIGR02145 family)